MFFLGNAVNLLNDQLLIGGFDAAEPEVLRRYGVTHIVDISGCELQDPPHPIKRLLIDLDDKETENIKKHFNETHDYIHGAVTNGGVVLIHCAAGISRSSTILCAYLMKSRRIRFQEALDEVRRVRPIVCPNYGFQNQLLQFEQELFQN
eukprot:TRINITY_DN8426_c0_g1_i1.p1 TRINITY_DN8426_c0_g1~~TRINITY_DN8426_c0_g1_i1.p1  ORF type:complete len:169 (+),score=42.74 TRINITY_DN8426_c0_g1_i1:61-507(+)